MCTDTQNYADVFPKAVGRMEKRGKRQNKKNSSPLHKVTMPMTKFQKQQIYVRNRKQSVSPSHKKIRRSPSHFSKLPSVQKTSGRQPSSQGSPKAADPAPSTSFSRKEMACVENEVPNEGFGNHHVNAHAQKTSGNQSDHSMRGTFHWPPNQQDVMTSGPSGGEADIPIEEAAYLRNDCITNKTDRSWKCDCREPGKLKLCRTGPSRL